MTPFQLRRAVRVIHAGGVIAYPTEAVWGLGCDPLDGAAVARILALKQRPAAKGLILVAADVDQLAPYLLPLAAADRARVEVSWPGPVTWLLPARPEVPTWLRGRYSTIAVRVSAHPVVRRLCEASGTPLVSTSANPAGRPPARSALGVRRYFGAGIDILVPGALGGRKRPSEIRDLGGCVWRN